MCGRYSMTFKEVMHLYRKYEQYLRRENFVPRDRYDIRPGTSVLALRNHHERGIELTKLKWGLLPHWSKEPQVKYSTFNARAESVEAKPAFRVPFRRRRCLIPATGWYEWQEAERGNKMKWHMRRRDGEAFSFAGLWDRWEREGRAIETCTIIVGEPNRKLGKIHDRMPVIADPKDYDFWLDPKIDAVPALRELLTPAPDEDIEARVVRNDKRPRDDDATLIEAVE
jgi:putative SOS response-associated peptidase YedK